MGDRQSQVGVFLREFEAPTDGKETVTMLEYDVCDKDAGPVHVSLARESYITDDKWSAEREFFRVTVKDRGSPTKQTMKKAVIFVRRLNDLIPVPDGCGRFLGFLRSSVDRSEYYVFEARRASPSTHGSDEAPTSHRPAREHAIGCHLRDIVACSCVFEGTSFHDAPPSEPKASEGGTDSWWEFPGTQQGSGV